METDKPKNLEYSNLGEQAQEAETEAADTDRLIAEIHAKIEELKRDRQDVLKDVELGLADKSSVAEIEGWITDAESRLSEMEQIKTQFASDARELETLHKKGKQILDEPTSGKAS